MGAGCMAGADPRPPSGDNGVTMKPTYLAAAVLSLGPLAAGVAPPSPRSEHAPGPIRWEENSPAVWAAAEQSRKPLFVLFR
jgi:hypothetical protein